MGKFWIHLITCAPYERLRDVLFSLESRRILFLFLTLLSDKLNNDPLLQNSYFKLSIVLCEKKNPPRVLTPETFKVR